MCKISQIILYSLQWSTIILKKKKRKFMEDTKHLKCGFILEEREGKKIKEN